MKPGADGWVTVTLSTTAVASAGMPERPVTWSSVVEPEGSGPNVVDTRVRAVQGGDGAHRVFDRHVAQQPAGLQNGRHLPGDDGAARRGTQHLDRARCGRHQAQHDVERRRLAGTVRAEERDDLSGRDLEV